jgi:hypothetical protein
MIRRTVTHPGIRLGLLFSLLALLSPLAYCQSSGSDDESAAEGIYSSNRNGNIYFKLSLGYMTQDHDQLNQRIKTSESFLTRFMIDEINGDLPDGQEPVMPTELPDWHTFSGTFAYNLEAGYHLSPALSLGLGINYQRSQVDNFIRTYTGSVGDDTVLRVLNLESVMIWQTSFLDWLYTGAELGVAFGEYRNELNYRYLLEPWSSKSFNAKYQKSAISAGLFTEIRKGISPSIDLNCRLGYRHLDLGKFTGKMKRIDIGEVDGSLYTPGGDELSLDFSGFYFNIGFRVDLQLPSYLR